MWLAEGIFITISIMLYMLCDSMSSWDVVEKMMIIVDPSEVGEVSSVSWIVFHTLGGRSSIFKIHMPIFFLGSHEMVYHGLTLASRPPRKCYHSSDEYYYDDYYY